jgi:hypothetical protein
MTAFILFCKGNNKHKMISITLKTAKWSSLLNAKNTL